MAQSPDENVINTLTTDQYGLLAAFDEFTNKYFDNKPDNNKLGLFGYINEIMAHTAKSHMFHRNMLYGELALNTAMLPSTIYNTAIDEGVDIPRAIPAWAKVIIDVKLSDVEKKLNESNGDYIVLDRNSFVVMLEDDEFRLPYSIILRRDNLSITAFYASVSFMDSHGETIPKEYDISDNFSKFINNPFIPLKVYIDEEEREKYISMRIDVYNYYVEEIENTIYADKLDGSLLFPVRHDNSLFEFFVQYKETEEDDWEIIPKFASNYSVDDEAKYCFYKIVDDSNYETYFSPNSISFRLAINSTVRNLTYTTKGSQCNYTFTGIPQASYPDSGLEFKAAIYNSPMGGKDKPNLLEYKKQIFNSRRNVAYKASEDDLNSYVADLSKDNFGDGSKVLFLKAQDDIITRMFLAYNMIMDQNKNPFPTNTADVDVGTTRFIDSTMPIVYDDTTNKYYLYNVYINETNPEIGLPELIQSYLKDENKFIYFTPFSTNIVYNAGDLSIEFYNENLNNIYSISYTKLASGSTDVPVINSIGTYRNSALNNVIETRMNVLTDTPENYRFLLCLVPENSDTIEYMTELKYDYSNEVFVSKFIAGLNSSGSRFIDGRMIIDSNPEIGIDGLTPVNATPYNGNYTIESSYRCILYTLEKIDEKSNILDNKYTFDYMFRDMMERLDTSEYAEYRIKASAETDESFIFFTSLNDVLMSDGSVYNLNGKAAFIIDSMPIVGANLLYSSERYDYFVSQLFKYIEIVKDIGMDLANSSRLSFKFYNTYGPSQQFSVYDKASATTAKKPIATKIKRTNLSLTLEVDREDGFDIDIDHKIKDICREFINEINNSITSKTALNSCISFSNLTTRIEKEIPSIISCNLTKLNNIDFPRKIFRHDDEYTMGKINYKNWITPEIIALDLRRKPSDMSNIEELNVETIYIS